MASPYKQTCQELLKPAGIKINGDDPGDIQVHNPKTYQRVLSQPSLGLGESYIEGWWDCDSLDEFFTKILIADLERKTIAGNLRASAGIAWNSLKSKIMNLQSKKRSRKVGKEHYDLDPVFEYMLDRRKVYSCAYWKDLEPDPDNLDEAQESKLELICQKVGIEPGMRVLDIGCGWGSFLKYASEKYGVDGVGVTISEEQEKKARKLCQGLPIDIRLQDYREINEKFNAIVSVGMFEHVGPKNYRNFMKVVDRNLREGSLFLLHTIGSNVSRTKGDPWMNNYIFSGGVLPSQEQIARSTEGILVNEDWHSFTDERGAYYDWTLKAWHKRFEGGWEDLKHLYGNAFKRMWDYYLKFSQGVFRSRRAQLWQIVFSKGDIKGYTRIR
jgi:cyclopropane-fatty-acyl-phospholipid synthase